MFVFSVLMISIIGLFFQIVNAQTSFLLNQQVSLGQQMMRWHSLAYAYACGTGTGKSKAVGETVTKADLDEPEKTEVAGSYDWNTVFFSGTYDGVATPRLMVTYVTPNERPSGFSAADVGWQILKLTARQHYRFTRSNAQATTLTTYYGEMRIIPITWLPMPLPSPQIPDNSVVLVSDASCP